MMHPQPENEFNDPPLKDAVKRCWACECAPAELREKLSRVLGSVEEQSAPQESLRFRRFQWMIWPVAAAAVLVVSFTLFNRPRVQSPLETASVFPASLQADLVSRHDRCCAHGDHQHLKVPRNDDAAIAAALHSQLDRPMLVAHPKDPGWTFSGAAICPVGTTPAGHLVFAKGDYALSVFSLPESLVPGAAEGNNYAGTLNQHEMVGFIKNGALFCLVESGPAGTVDVKDLEQMQQDMEPAVAMLPVHATPLAVVELLHPIDR